MEPKVNQNIERLQAKQPPLQPVKKISTFAAKVASKNTEHWYESKNVWLAALQAGIAIYTGDYRLFFTAASQLIGPNAARADNDVGVTLPFDITNHNATGAINRIYFTSYDTQLEPITIDALRISSTEIGDYVVPAAPTGLSPANAATGVSITPTLTCDAQADADSFYFKLSKNADLSSALYDTMVVGNSLNVSLDYITQYYWSLNPWNLVDTTFSDTISFTTKKLATPTNRIPIANATYVDSATTFSWAANAEADSYFVQIGDSALASLVLDTAIVANSLLYTLVNDSSYWWSVLAKNTQDTSAWADTTKFTTGIAPVSSTIKRDFGGYTKFKGFK